MALRAAGAGLLVERLDTLVGASDCSGAVTHFMRNAMGIPAPFVALMRLMPMSKGLKATAHTLPYDLAAPGEHMMYGTPLKRRGVGRDDRSDARRVRRQEPRGVAAGLTRACRTRSCGSSRVSATT